MHSMPEFVRHSGKGLSNLGLDPEGHLVLEVTEIWQDLVLETAHLPPRGPSVRIGTSRFPVPEDAIPHADEHVLYRWDGTQYVARLHSTWGVTAEAEGTRLSLDDLLCRGLATRTRHEVHVPIGEGLRLLVDAEGVLFFAHLVRRAAWLDTRGSEDEDWSFPFILGLVGFLGAMFALIIWTAPDLPVQTIHEVPDDLIALVIQQQRPETPVLEQAGTAGPKAPDAHSTPAPRKTTEGGQTEAASLDEEVVSGAGLFGAWEDAGLEALEGTGLSAELIGGVDGMKGVRRVRIGGGIADAGRCCGHRGPGTSGWGGPEGTGPIGTHGLGGDDLDFGGDVAIERSAGEDLVLEREIITLGCMERSVVDEVAKTHLSRIRYCYQRMLQRDPTLAGKVTMRFTIARDGSVSTANTKFSNLDNPEVQACLNERFLRMQFPKPKGCDTVIVSYPFLFSPG
ncbi:MAG: AgmX/PglI C-terminal domain-containing protein [Deltaproteobacteria bacterium]|nr:AgmX/PglI C-terminal domain-containing protein [Deltaproteobacteria bacterium]